jgi:hypothetical protein
MPLVRHTGDQGTFSVSSADDTDPYTVDLMANEGFMACTCRDWQCRCAPLARERKPLKAFGTPTRGYCKHIHAVLLFLGQTVAAQLNGKERTDIFEDKL